LDLPQKIDFSLGDQTEIKHFFKKENSNGRQPAIEDDLKILKMKDNLKN
jgi:hypothetical protein